MRTAPHDLAERLASVLNDQTLDHSALGTGLPVSLRFGRSSRSDVARGYAFEGDPLLASHLHPIYCLGKPVLANAVWHLFADGFIDLDTTVREAAGQAHPWVEGATTVVDLLTHNAGLHRPTAMEWRMNPPAARVNMVPPGSKRAPAYSEIIAGLVLEDILIAVTGHEPAAFIERSVLRPMGLHNDFYVSGGQLLRGRRLDRVRPPVYVEALRRPIPLLSERLPREVLETRTAFGSYATMSAVATWMHAAARAYRGDCVAGMAQPETVRKMLDLRRGRQLDATLQRECDFAAGLSVGLEDHGVVSTSPLSGTVFFQLAGLTNSSRRSDQLVLRHAARGAAHTRRLSERDRTRSRRDGCVT